MTRTRVRWDRILVLVVLLLGVLALAGRAFGGSEPPATERYRVQAGDTLWGIARLRVGAVEDPRPMVEELRRLNQVDPGELAPGMRLLIPAA